MQRWLRELWQWLRSGAAGAMATLVDLAVLTVLVSVVGVGARAASIPALILGGVANFLGNRHFAFKAAHGSLRRQLVGYTVVEVIALLLNGVLYDSALRLFPSATHLYWLVRIITSHIVFLGWSYPLWRQVFRVRQPVVA